MLQKMKNLYHLGVAILANIFYWFPSRNLKVIGITGTDGKTTTSSLVYHILKTSGQQVSLISTVSAVIGNKAYDTGFHVTNPAPFALQKFLKMASKMGKKRKTNYLVLEVTSHGIDQNRIWGIHFAVAGITNITHEHLDYHKTYANYVATKTRLLQQADTAVVNKDDGSYKLVKKLLGKKLAIVTYAKASADITLDTVPFKNNLPGEYNTYNCLLAVAICKQLGISDADIKAGITSFILPKGRTETVYDKSFRIMIDFAHTPNAISQLLRAVRPTTSGKIIHIFGSAGLRDRTKRPLMGKASAEYADVIILTAEDPRTEKIETISSQIKSGISKSLQETRDIREIPDRQEAILRGVALAAKGDLVVITGKAHENSMNYGHGEIPWSDYEAVKKALVVHG